MHSLILRSNLFVINVFDSLVRIANHERGLDFVTGIAISNRAGVGYDDTEDGERGMRIMEARGSKTVL